MKNWCTALTKFFVGFFKICSMLGEGSLKCGCIIFSGGNLGGGIEKGDDEGVAWVGEQEQLGDGASENLWRWPSQQVWLILIRVKETISLRERSGMAENHGFDGDGLSLASAEPLAELV